MKTQTWNETAVDTQETGGFSVCATTLLPTAVAHNITVHRMAKMGLRFFSRTQKVSKTTQMAQILAAPMTAPELAQIRSNHQGLAIGKWATVVMTKLVRIKAVEPPTQRVVTTEATAARQTQTRSPHSEVPFRVNIGYNSSRNKKESSSTSPITRYKAGVKRHRYLTHPNISFTKGQLSDLSNLSGSVPVSHSRRYQKVRPAVTCATPDERVILASLRKSKEPLHQKTTQIKYPNVAAT
eukprot:Protomagalhaensia_sp_Gyna_25__5693@NODE_80_length_5479_cov_47_848346_g61_i0_p4_GENE_NODE_80_length_5479_cov_47_848346_g61_i0NODE_80_length_5479_cov_47_848346_g61_i0_p4_ORF_typecomplete_len239_score18_06_NODE_80_length_5479_cov_47_848346_g61_i05941310